MIVEPQDLADLRREFADMNRHRRFRGLWFLYDGEGRPWVWWLLRAGWSAVLLVPFAWVPWPAEARMLKVLDSGMGFGVGWGLMLLAWRLLRGAAEAFTASVQAQGWRRTKARGAYWLVAAFFLPFLFVVNLGTSPGLEGWWAFQGFLVCLFLAFMLLMELFVGFRRLSEAREAAEDAAQRLRLEPHFLFNVLNGIQAQIPRDPEAASVALEKVGRLQRRLLALVERPMVPLEEELSFVEDYLGLQRLRLGSKLRVRLEVPEEAESLPVPTLAVHSLVENAIKHGLARRPDGGELRIWARVEPRYEAFHTAHDLTVGVENDLGNAEAAPVPAGTGTGLASLRARLQDPSDLRVEQDGARFRATLIWRQP